MDLYFYRHTLDKFPPIMGFPEWESLRHWHLHPYPSTTWKSTPQTLRPLLHVPRHAPSWPRRPLRYGGNPCPTRVGNPKLASDSSPDGET
jgi:hypothetical protein